MGSPPKREPIQPIISNSLEALSPINETGAKELLIKCLMVDNAQFIKTEESQKTINIDGPEADKVIDYI